MYISLKPTLANMLTYLHMNSFPTEFFKRLPPRMRTRTSSSNPGFKFCKCISLVFIKYYCTLYYVNFTREDTYTGERDHTDTLAILGDILISYIWYIVISTTTILLNTSVIKIENFKMRIGIAEKSHETRRDHWGGNVNHISLFWLNKIEQNTAWWSIMKLKC